MIADGDLMTFPDGGSKEMAKGTEMKIYIIIVEKTDTGYSAYAKDDHINAVTVGSTITEVKKNALESLNLLYEQQGKKQVTLEDISIQLDLPQVFDYFEINAKAFSERIKMNTQLLNQYINGSKEPSAKQISKITKGLREFGKELMELDYM